MAPDSRPIPPLNLKRRFAVTSLAVIVVIALGLGWLLSNMLTQRMLQREGEVTMDFVQNLLTTDHSGGFFLNPQDPELRTRFLSSMEHVTSMREPVRANAYSRDGTMLWSTDAALVGRRYPVNDELDDALKGELVVHSGRLGSEGPAKAEHEGLALRAPFFVESYIPVRDAPGGQVVGVMEFYKVPVQLNEAIREGLIQLWLACAASALGLFLSLYWIVARADRALREQQARLAETQTLATAVELAGAVAHNLRNPLASIRVSAEMLQDGTSEPAETTEHCQDITSAVDRADRWITELVRVSQAPQLQDEAVALGPLVRACLEEMGAEMMRRNIRWQAPEHDPAPVRAHPAMLRQIVLSLIANAIDAMPDGGEITATLQQTGARCVLRLTDTGHGISDEVRQRLFRPFFSTKSGGLGIGLALVKRMVTQWQGEVTLSANSPRGTCVEIVLPRAATS
ncbi:MAG: HAMP domain-containing histidine kinase [Comamonadaceae bacterium]|nr:HAMP domain-containing histidine kinase [Comamonadaceae bacterium]